MFYGCIIISSKTGLQEENFWEKYLVENFIWLQNNLLENRYAWKKILEKNFSRIIFVVAKSCFPKQVSMKKRFEKKFLVEMFYGCKIFFSKTGLNEKKNSEQFSRRKCFWLQNHFLENRFVRKTFLRKMLRSNIFYGRKIISSKTGLNENSLAKIFGQ